ncbi:MAG TPA: SDR family NAD(P)-dependent oxidoreductase [Candidatus Limnocylindrales bacterium]|nr:SDR family NAD(P)-dependent oxidoreductase [Candidatus Limnocylindrales bacterium]
MAKDVVLITGGNAGIGFACARALARRGWHVLMASRDRSASAAAVARLRAESGAEAASEMGLDLASQASVRALAAEVTGRGLPLRALVCNAGLQFFGRPRFTAEGHEMTFAVNHLGHFLLANLLLDHLRAHAPSRIVVVSSGVHDPKRWTGMPKADISDLATLAATGGPEAGRFRGGLAYVNSKLCNLWFTYELVRRLQMRDGSADGVPAVTVNAFDPGLTPGSSLTRDYPSAVQFGWNRLLPGLARVLSPVVAGINTVEQAGTALARLVDDPQLARLTGRYFPSHTRWKEAPSSPASYDAARARELWEMSERLCGTSATASSPS